MSNITIAIIRRNTIFLSEEDLKKALERTGLRHRTLQNGDIEVNDIMTLQKMSQGYMAVFKVEMRYGQLTYAGKRTEMMVMDILSNIEDAYRNVIEERIERLRKYEDEKLREMASEEERKKKEILLRRERMKLERLRKKEEEMKRKSIEEKIEKLRAKARAMGYDIQEEVRENERVLVLVRRR